MYEGDQEGDVAKMTLAQARQKWEGSPADRKLDKRLKVKENSAADKRMDTKGAKKLMKKGKR